MIRHGKLLHSFFFLIIFLTLCAFSGLTPQKEENGYATEDATLPVRAALNNCGINFNVPDNSCTASNNYNFFVPTASGSQLGVDVVLEEVHLILEHPWNADADIFLVAPSGIEVELSTDNGGGSDNYGDPTDPSCSAYTTFSMKACESITTGEAPFIGSYLPEGDLNGFNNGSSPIGNWTLRICDDAPDDVGVLHFIELIFSDNSCSPPINVEVDRVGATSIDLRWISPNATCSSTVIEYGPPGFVPGDGPVGNEGTAISIPCGLPQPYVLNGLEELTDYDVYIREFCSAGAFSANSCLVQLSTNCSTGTSSLEANFDGFELCAASCAAMCPISGPWLNSEGDDMDWLVDEGGTTSSRTGPEDDITGGGHYLYMEASGSGCQSGAQAILQSHCLQIEAANGLCHLSFYYHLYGVNTGSLSLEIRTESQSNWQSLFSISGDQDNEWYRQFIDLSAYDGQVAQLRFVGARGNGFRSDMAIDQIEFYGTTDIGARLFTYYADTDGDQYGDPASTIGACWMQAPLGFVDNDEDCDDANGNVFPGAEELLCNGIDDNCNGDGDDALIPLPLISDVGLCSGDALLLEANSQAFGTFYWRLGQSDGPLLGVGDSLLLSDISSSQVIYLTDSLDGGCQSDPLPINIDIWALPDLELGMALAVCESAPYRLADLSWTDLNQTNASLTFHSSSPATAGNLISDSLIYPTQGQVYYALATSAQGCTNEASFSIPLISAPSAQISPSGPLEICSNGTTVLEALESVSGLPPFQYTWSNGDVGRQTTVSAGQAGATELFSLTVTDAQGCSDNQSLSLSTISSINSVAIDSLVNISTCDGNDGRIRLRPLNGIGPFRYEWEGPTTGSINNIPGPYTLEGLEQGTYRVTISDNTAQACQMVVPLLALSGPSVVIDPFILTGATSCAGASDGFIDITVDGNQPTYTWSNGDTTEDLMDAPAGLYSVTVSDNNCDNVLENLLIEEPQALQANVFAIESTSCPGSMDGRIDISVSGGSPPYTFLWSNGQENEDVMDLQAATYSVLVTDANLCTYDFTDIVVEAPEALGIELADSRAPSCIGAADGQLDILISGGTPPYTYYWSDSSSAADAIGLLAGDYTVTITDANGCTEASSHFSISNPPALQLSLVELLQASCDGLSDGTIRVQASGGDGQYQYAWSTGANTAELSNLPIGIYHLTLTDGQGCQLISSDYQVTAPEVLSLDRVFIQQAACFGVSDGFIDVEVSGGTTPYQYNWNTKAETEDIFNLAEGMYDFTVTDANGCQLSSAPIEITYLEALAVQTDAVLDVRCADGADGAIFISPPNGSPPYQYEWSNGATTEDVFNLPRGQYSGTIVDGTGCILFTDTFTISEPAPLAIDILSVEPASCSNAADGSIDVQVSGGVPPYQYSWTNGWTEEDLSNADAGLYQLTVLDGRACAISSTIIFVDQGSDLEVEALTSGNIGCNGGDQGRIELMIEGGTMPFEIEWSTGDTGMVIDKLAAGTYAVTVSDANGCEFQQAGISIEQTLDSIAVPIMQYFDVSCPGANDGSIDPG
ncbi:MAG: MopE-related protein, partial [Bacteroidota bacterium]